MSQKKRDTPRLYIYADDTAKATRQYTYRGNGKNSYELGNQGSMLGNDKRNKDEKGLT